MSHNSKSKLNTSTTATSMKISSWFNFSGNKEWIPSAAICSKFDEDERGELLSLKFCNDNGILFRLDDNDHIKM